MTYLIQHFTLKLLDENVIDFAKEPSLFDEALKQQKAIRTAMSNIGKELVVDEARGVIGIRNFTEEQCDTMAEAAGAPPLPVFQRARLSFYESAVLLMIYSHKANHQASDEEAAWIEEDNMVELLLYVFPEKHQKNEVSLHNRIVKILKKLETLGYTESRDADGKVFWRGTRFLEVVLTNDLANQAATAFEFLKMKKEAAAADLEDLEDDAAGEEDTPTLFDRNDEEE